MLKYVLTGAQHVWTI